MMNIKLKCFERLERRDLLAAVELDPSFGVDGIARTDFSLHRTADMASVSALQDDGKIVLAGVSEGRFAVARYLPNGQLDNSLSSDGKLTFAPIVGTSDPIVNGMAVQPDGKIILVGSVVIMTGPTAGQRDVAILRLHRSGGLDNSFSSDGIDLLDLGSPDDAATDVAIQPDGKILVSANAGGSVNRAFMLRYLRTGQLDSTFSGDGQSPLATTGSRINTLALQPDGQVLAGGYLSWEPLRSSLVVRFKTNGSLDDSFGENAKLDVRGGLGPILDIGLMPDSRFYVAGTYTLRRYTANGTWDRTFAPPSPFFTQPSDYLDRPKQGVIESIVVTPDGGVAVVGTQTRHASVIYLDSVGRLNESFSGNGRFVTWTETVGAIHFTNLLQRADGSLLATGSIVDDQPGFDFAIYSFHPLVFPTDAAKLFVNSDGQIELVDTYGHDDRWQFSRTNTAIVIRDLSPDPNFRMAVEGLPTVTGAGTKVLSIPLTTLRATSKPLIISSGDGDDIISIANQQFEAPLYGMRVRGGAGSDALLLDDYESTVTWVVAGDGSGSMRPFGKVPIGFAQIEKTLGAGNRDIYQVTHVPGGPKLSLSSLGPGLADTFELRANVDITTKFDQWPEYMSYLQVGNSSPQLFATGKIAIWTITTGASNNIIDMPIYGGFATIRAGAGNDKINFVGTGVIYGEDGDDYIVAGDAVTAYGGAGNDTLIAASGTNSLFGEAGLDILVGGNRSDWLEGGTGSDLLIGGFSSVISPSTDPSILAFIQRVWTSTDTYASRIEQLKVTGFGPGRSLKLTLGTTVLNDDYVDTYFGGAGEDWFFLDTESELDVLGVGLRDRQAGEVVN